MTGIVSFIGRHKAKFALGAIMAGAFAWAYLRTDRDKIPIVDDILYRVGVGQETIFRGKVNDWSVFYEERNDGNHMLATRGPVTVEYTDKDPSSALNWDANSNWDTEKNSPRILTDNLEIVLFNNEADKKGWATFDRSTIDPKLYSSKAKTQVFTEADLHYNSIRQEIIRLKRAEVDASATRYIEGVKGK